MRLKTNVIIAAACISIQSMAHNPNDPDSLSVEPIRLRDINVVRRVNHLSEISKVDLAVNPVKSSQEILRSVPVCLSRSMPAAERPNKCFFADLIWTTAQT